MYVIRYFGGKKLVIPGLIHAYSETIKLALLNNKLISPKNILKIKTLQYNNTSKNLESQINQTINFKGSVLNNLKRLLNSNSIDNNLRKGFVILEKSKKIIRQSNQLDKIDKVKIKFIDRKIDVKIQKI